MAEARDRAMRTVESSGNDYAPPRLRLIPADEGRPVLGGRMLLKVAGAETNDAFTLCFGVTPPGLGPPLHTHARDDQTHYVVAGTYELICGPDVVIGGPGACVHMPRYTPHTFRNVGSVAAELVEFTAPGGIDRYFDAAEHLGPLATDLEARNEVGRPFGMSFPDDPEAYLDPPPGETRRPAMFVSADGGRRLGYSEYEAIRKIEPANTNGSHSLTEWSLPAEATAALSASGPMVLVALVGTVTVRVNEEWAVAGPGDSVTSLSGGEAVAETGEQAARFIVYVIEAGS